MSIEDLNWWQVGRMDFICLFYFQKFSLRGYQEDCINVFVFEGFIFRGDIF